MRTDRAEEIIRQKITALETTEDDTSVDTGKLWEALHRQSNKNISRKKQFAFYWAAAAIVLIIIAIGFLLLPAQVNYNDTLATTEPTDTSAAIFCTIETTNEEAFSSEYLDPPGMYAMPADAMICYNTNIPDTILSD